MESLGIVDVFRILKDIGEFRRRNMPYIQTLEDLELLREIGLHQQHGRPITLKVLFQQGISSVATIQRRLGRLKRLGVVQQTRAGHDGRILELTLNPKTLAGYRKIEQMMRGHARKPAAAG